MSLVLMSSLTYSTTFRPLTIKQQVSSSDSIIYGEVLSKESIESENNQIVTKVTLRADKWIGSVKSDEMSDLVDVYYPGGVINGREQQIIGAPKLTIGESVVLMVKKGEKINWISNLGLGKFSVKRVGNQKVLFNQIFPNKPDVGQIELKSFYQLVEGIKGEKLLTRYKDKYEIIFDKEYFAHINDLKKKTKKSGRSIASISDEGEEAFKKDSHKIETIWLVILLGLLALFIRTFKNKTS